MYQYSLQVQDCGNGFAHEIKDLKQRLSSVPTDRLLFHVHSTVFSIQTLSLMISTLREQFRGCQIVCCTVSGSALDYAYQQGIILSAEVFERDSSRFEAHAYDMTHSSDKAALPKLWSLCGTIPG